MGDLHEVLCSVVRSGFVMKDFEALSEPSKIETTSKTMYFEINRKPFTLNKRLMKSAKLYYQMYRDYRNAFTQIQDIAVINPVTTRPDYVRP